MRRGIVIPATVAAAVAMAVGVAVASGYSLGSDRGAQEPAREVRRTAAAEREVTTTTRHSDSITGVVVDSDSGDIEASPGPTTVVRTERWTLARPTVTEAVRDGVLTITARCPREVASVNRCSTRFRINAPAGAWVKFNVSAGDVTARDFRGVHTVTSSAGDVSVVGARATRVTATTSAGDVVVDLLATPDDVTARSSAGDVAVTIPRGRYAVTVRTNAGESQVSDIRHDPTATRRVEARTSSGDVVVRGR